MQLSGRFSRLAVARLVALGAALSAPGPGHGRAQVEASAGTSAFREAGGPLSMTVLVPEVRAAAEIGSGLGLQAGWSADVISGASVAVVDLPAESVDAIASATVRDTRHVLDGGFEVADGRSAFGASYRHAFENDYRSHAFDLHARTELFERNSVLEINYGRAFDAICDGPDASEAVLKQKLDDSDGCFDAEREDRRERDLFLHAFRAAWTQNWTAALSTQLTATAQLLHGFQANAYRAVRIGRSSAQEHHPEQRARYAVGLAARIWIAPLRGALQPSVRVYRDTWDIRSLSTELGYAQNLGHGLRLRARGRFYTQTGAAFYSDDYLLAPRGRYFTGDRELSPMHSALVGAQLVWLLPGDEQGRVLGALDRLELALKGDLLKSFFEEFHYDRAPVPNDTALLGSISLGAGF